MHRQRAANARQKRHVRAAAAPHVAAAAPPRTAMRADMQPSAMNSEQQPDARREPFFARVRHVFTREQPTKPSTTEAPPAAAAPERAEEEPQPAEEAPAAEEAQPSAPPEQPPTAAPRAVLVHDDPNNIEQLAETIASAFEEDPMITYLHGPHAKHAHEKALIFNRTVLHGELSRPKGHTTIHVTDDNSCVAIWHHPRHRKITGLYCAKFMIALVRTFGWRALLMGSAMRQLEQAHPKEPHMYLFIMGTHKDHQGKGHGSTVIAEMLKHCDLERLPAYLESSNQRNLSFYRRHGFELIQQIQAPRAGCPPLYTMWREPRPIQKQ
ncbi:GNAT family N-acetyltransferase [Gracilaria domingensis]|nr:GNAT family N-acetyltransferase [Gracilaria domingensis]